VFSGSSGELCSLLEGDTLNARETDGIELMVEREEVQRAARRVDDRRVVCWRREAVRGRRRACRRDIADREMDDKAREDSSSRLRVIPKPQVRYHSFRLFLSG
jgi:GAF domain-containing protein